MTATTWNARDYPDRDPLTLIETTTGSLYGTNRETPDDAMQRLVAAGYLVQRLGNLVRMVARVDGWGGAR